MTTQGSFHLFTLLQLRDVRLRNRVMVSPMCQYSSIDGYANDWHLVHLGSRAVGGAAVPLTEAAAVTTRAGSVRTTSASTAMATSKCFRGSFGSSRSTALCPARTGRRRARRVQARRGRRQTDVGIRGRLPDPRAERPSTSTRDTRRRKNSTATASGTSWTASPRPRGACSKRAGKSWRFTPRTAIYFTSFALAEQSPHR